MVFQKRNFLNLFNHFGKCTKDTKVFVNIKYEAKSEGNDNGTLGRLSIYQSDFTIFDV